MGRLLHLIVFLFLLTGCSGPGKNLVGRHPLKEARMSAAAQDGYVATGVWRISGAHNTVYLAGTSHLVAEDQIPFPSTFYAAYQDSKEIYIEYNTHSLFNNLRVIPKVTRWILTRRQQFVCPRGQELSDYVSPEIYSRLKTRYGKAFKRIRYAKPEFVVFMAEFESASEDGRATSGVEDVFMHAARKDGKRLRPLDDQKVIDTVFLALDEMFDEAVRAIARQGADAVINERVLARKREELPDSVWRYGDMETLLKLEAEMKREAPVFYREALVVRNQKWMPSIQEALGKPHNVLILCGAAHLAGEAGLLKLLSDAGYAPTQLYGLDRP